MEDLRSTLVQMLYKRTGGDASSHLQKVLLERVNQRPPGDPLRDALGLMLAQQQPVSQKPRSDPQELLRAACDALNVMQKRSAAIAAALGACAECWGTEAGCPQCSGLGHPGWAAPDPAAFAIWVTPAVRAMSQSANNATTNQNENVPG